jgi:dTDP-4-dehydrorhamnose reductase
MLAAAQHRPELRVVADQKGSPTSALDLAAAILRLAEQIKDSRADLLGKTFHLGGRGEASWFELASATMEEAEAAGLPFARVRPIDSSDWPTRARRPAYSVLDSRRFELATGFTMPHWRGSLETIIRRLAEAR